MKQFITIVIVLFALTGCKESKKIDTQAAETDSTEIYQQKSSQAAAKAMQKIESLYSEGRYMECIDSIKQLRKNFPTAIEERKRCIDLYEEANMHFAESEVARMQTELAETQRAIAATQDHEKGNLLRNKRDTLQARIEANRTIIQMTKQKLESNANLRKLGK